MSTVVAVVTDTTCRLTGDTTLGTATVRGADLTTVDLALANTLTAAGAYIVILVNTALTVIIHTVTPLFGVGVNRRLGVITVAFQGGVVRIGGSALTLAVTTLTITVIVVI